MAKSRSKISRQAVKRSASGTARAQSRKPSRPAKSRGKTAALAKAAAKGKWVYAFGGGKAQGRAGMRDLLGGKGAGLAEMAHLGLPVPPGFTITTEVCTYFYQHGKTYPKDLKPQVEAALAEIGRITNKTFGDGKNPLLVSVRSGARASMPGMMDTVLNLGLNDRRSRRSPRNPATGASPMTATGASSPCMPTWCSASATTTSRKSSTSTRTATATRSTPTLPPTTGRSWSGATRSASKRRAARRFRRTRTRNYGARSAPCSARG